MKQKLVVLTGAGISAESGIPTFRGADGLWEGHDIMDVASPQGYAKNPALVLDFYNKRRQQLAEVKPNKAHQLLGELEQHFDIHIITQNVDDLHERGGSTKVLHLHGLLTKARSSIDETLVYDIGTKPINLGDVCDKGSQLRPHIVWFGEAVPAMEEAMAITATAEIFVVVGTSLQVYPAASLLFYVNDTLPKYIIDPNIPEANTVKNLTKIEATASKGMAKLCELLLKDK